jgi:hypothetical protein
MQRALNPSSLVPRGFDVESAFCDGAMTVITVRPTSRTSLCPGCNPALSGPLADISDASPIHGPGRSILPMVMARRFVCMQ